MKKPRPISRVTKGHVLIRVLSNPKFSIQDVEKYRRRGDGEEGKVVCASSWDNRSKRFFFPNV